MIITQKKPLDEVWQMLEGVTRVALVGCGAVLLHVRQAVSLNSRK